MSGARAPLDLEAPLVVACETLVGGAGRLRRGDLFPWRDLGMSEMDVALLWGAQQVDVDTRTATADLDLDRLSAAQLAELERATAPVATVTMRVTPGEHVRVTSDPPRAPAPSSKRPPRR
jgi:hypothetical protein